MEEPVGPSATGKFLAAGASLVALLAVVIGVQALRNPLYRSEATLVIDAPAKAVFPWIADPARQLRWVDGLKVSAQVEKGPTRRGAVWHQRIDLGGHTFLTTNVITAYDPPWSFGWEATMQDGFTSTQTWTVSQSGGVSTVTVVDETRYVAALGKAFGVFAVGPTGRKLAADLGRLRGQLAESTGSAR